MANQDQPDTPETPSTNGAGQPPRRPPRLLHNPISEFGLAVVGLATTVSLSVFFFEITSSQASPAYLGLVYMLSVSVLVGGGVLVALGREVERRRRAQGKAPIKGWWEGRFSRQTVAVTFFIAALVITVSVAVGSYKAFQGTESVAFCGQLCHSVMHPEWNTYNLSSHARVSCVECHIGAGAGWYVKSKISGIRQIFAVALGTYPKPIPTPIKDLRPARETCEECHWPSKFIGYKIKTRSYFLANESNSAHHIRLLMKIGGERAEGLGGAGIHYHMLLASKVEYIARDRKRQEIAWVRIKRGDGSVTEYNNSEKPLTEKEKEGAEVRVMDCMDCHNRPAHQFPSPMHAVNESIQGKAIPITLPFIKREATYALDGDYETTEQAVIGIANHLREFYKEDYPEVFAENQRDLGQAIAETQAIFRRSNFPEMKANWKAYPDNLGHRDWPGCFRCHNENMEAKNGDTIFTTCDKCHIIMAQGPNVSQGKVDFEKGEPFYHPPDEDYLKEYTMCTDCHTGGKDVYE